MALRSIVLLLVLAAPLPAQRTERHPELGLIVTRPPSYEARPAPPGDDAPLLVYAPADAPGDRRAPATLAIHRFPLEGDAALAVERWVLDEFRPRRLEAVRSVRERGGRRPHRFEGELVDAQGAPRTLFVHAWSSDVDAFVVVGEGEPARAKQDRRRWERFAESMRFIDAQADSGERARWERHYGQRSYSHAEQRIERRLALVDGWEARDTEHYLILFHGASDAPLLRLVAERLEVLRQTFTGDFEPDGVVDVLPVVRVCRDRGEYLTYGGESWTAGFFNANEGELVIYDAREDVAAALDENHPTLRTLHHEACHQYLHSTAGALPPHTWYDEGTAEYYAGARFDGVRLLSIEPLAQRAAWLARQLADGVGPALADLLAMDRATFYADASIHYSMAWSLVYFLRTSEDPRLSGVLTRYFTALKEAWRREVEELGKRGLTRGNVDRARAAAREAALARALEGVDVALLEERWREWAIAGGSANSRSR